MYYGAYLLTFLLIITVHKDKKLSKSLYRSLYTCLVFKIMPRKKSRINITLDQSAKYIFLRKKKVGCSDSIAGIRR